MCDYLYCSLSFAVGKGKGRTNCNHSARQSVYTNVFGFSVTFKKKILSHTHLLQTADSVGSSVQTQMLGFYIFHFHHKNLQNNIFSVSYTYI